jgi:Ca-activated chloride channel family protein
VVAQKDIKMIKFLHFLLFLPLVCVYVGAQAQSHVQMRKGEDLYDQNSFAKSEMAYRKATGSTAAYNAGNAAYQQGKFNDAMLLFKNAAQGSSSNPERANALYNMGNAFLQLGQYDEAIEAYEKSLRLLPNASDAKKNLQIAKKIKQDLQDPPPQPPPPPPPPPVERPRKDYLDQADPSRQKGKQPLPLTAEAARQMLANGVQQQEAQNASDYRGLAPATKPSRVKKDW